MKAKILKLFLLTTVIFTSCNKEENTTKPITSADVLAESKIDAAIADISSLIENQYIAQESFSNKQIAPASLLPSCAVVTTDRTFTSWTRTVDFGTSGCELSNGNVFRGKIIMHFGTDFSTLNTTISYTFENFYHNDNHIEGNKTMTRVRENANGNPESSFAIDMHITFADGSQYDREGIRTSEWAEGSDTPWNLSDDVHVATGNWSTTFPDGSVDSGEITTPIRRSFSCRYTSEGVLELHRNSDVAILDYGNGDCDNVATVTINGVTREITLFF